MGLPMKVRATSSMEPGEFAKHFNLRHREQEELTSMIEVSERSMLRDRDVWEAYHKRLHETKEYDHEH
jgi:hypothetical protein